ncbi:MAG: PD40 domain-containing protein [Chloroflexi bacterium]|nr:PD40 domain-containing protein [Chloroflexota bacterium]
MKTLALVSTGLVSLFTLLALAALAVAPMLAHGGQLAYLSNCGGQWDIYLLDTAHSRSVNVTRSAVNENAFIWSPEGQQLGFLFYTGALQNIYALTIPGGQPRPTTLELDTWLDGLVQPTPVRGDWSRDHTRRVYELADELYIMDRGVSRQLTDNTYTDASPSWSPDERQIAFASSRDGSLDIYVMNSDGSNVERLTNDAARDSSPAWSPDGREIAFTSLRNGNAEIYLMDTRGQNMRRLTANTCWDDRAAWRPGP